MFPINLDMLTVPQLRERLPAFQGQSGAKSILVDRLRQLERVQAPRHEQMVADGRAAANQRASKRPAAADDGAMKRPAAAVAESADVKASTVDENPNLAVVAANDGRQDRSTAWKAVSVAALAKFIVNGQEPPRMFMRLDVPSGLVLKSVSVTNNEDGDQSHQSCVMSYDIAEPERQAEPVD